MPCYDPQPDYRDKRAMDAYDLIVYVFNFVGEGLPKNTPDTPDGYYMGIGFGKHLDLLTSTLCSKLNEIKESDKDLFNKLVYDPHSRVSRRLADWWEDHDDFDKKRAVYEEK